MIKDSLHLRAPAWTKIMGFAPMRWSSEVDLRESRCPESQCSMAEAPRAGQEYSVAFEGSLFSAGASIWTLFVPPLSLFNGLSAHPEELLQSCLVQLVLLRSLGIPEPRYGTYQTPVWHAAKVIDVVRIGELTQRFDEESAQAIPVRIEGLRDRISRTDWQDFTIFELSIEGDAGLWLICRKAGNGHTALVYGEWDWDTDFVYAGNCLLNSEEWSTLAGSGRLANGAPGQKD
jgi:hypothetical protein